MNAPATRCSKRRFDSKGAALDVRRHVGNRVRVYFCDECRAWHTTNEDKYAHERPFRRKGIQ